MVSKKLNASAALSSALATVMRRENTGRSSKAKTLHALSGGETSCGATGQLYANKLVIGCPLSVTVKGRLVLL